MILLEILSSPDKTVLYKFEFHQNQIYIGRNSASLNIADPGLLDSHALIEVVENELIFHPQAGVSSYLIDGKRASNVRKIRLFQAITVANTCLRILEFKETKFRSKKAILDEKLAKLIDENSHRIQVIEQLGRMMK